MASTWQVDGKYRVLTRKENEMATLVWRGKTADGTWARGTLVKSKNGKYRPGYMLHKGLEMYCPTGVYQVRTICGGKATYLTVGTDLAEALKAEQSPVETTTASAKAPAKAAGETIRVLADKLLASKAEKSRDLAHGTIRMWHHTLPALVTVLERRGTYYIEDVTLADVGAYMSSIQNLAQTTRATRYILARAFLVNSGMPKEIIPAGDHRRWRSKGEEDITAYTEAQIDAILAHSNDYYKVVWQLLLLTGLRYQEATNMVWANVNLPGKCIAVPARQEIWKNGERFLFRSKSRKGRVIPINSELAGILTAWREKNPNTVYVVGAPGLDTPNCGWREALKRTVKRAGISCHRCQSCSEGKGCEFFYPHRYRHTYAQRVLDAGIPIHKMSRWLGHSSIAVTSIYLRSGGDDNSKLENI